MAKAKATKKKAKSGKENAVISYLRGTRAELRKVHWPTREEAWSLTQIVLIVTISMALLLGLLDYLFAQELGGILDADPVAVGVAVVVVVASVLVAVFLGRRTA